MQKILCVEDSPETLMVLEATLGKPRLTVATSVREAFDLLNEEDYSLVLLDIELPDGTGFEVMAALSERLRGTPIIILTGKRDFASKVSAFSLGADDFVMKPFDPRELKLRIDSKLKKVADASDDKSRIRVGPVVCQLQEQRLFLSGNKKAVDLTSLEVRIFHLLAQAPNKIFSRAEILGRVWGDSISVTERAVDVHVSNLRKKLEGSGVNVEAVIGTGYRIYVERSFEDPAKKSI
jgi:DNA-binding response OmpR family regulator